ncbi:hypothetical protein QR98_0040430 [Sarcoptes scabiei]|uniref:Uncharacterized protein n=1 Tax=Sarcoptes scabiei TaxID=52283 RepID=A0A132A3K4_SARSC|nr:hypothetical protein QR98_0040430 [Sarcoptes scabiei]
MVEKEEEEGRNTHIHIKICSIQNEEDLSLAFIDPRNRPYLAIWLKHLTAKMIIEMLKLFFIIIIIIII